MISTSDFKKGIAIIFNDDPWIIVEFKHVKVARGGATIKTKMKNIKNGNVLEHTFKSGETVKEAELTYNKVQYLYSDDSDSYFMDENYEQVPLSLDIIEKRKDYLVEESQLDGVYLDGKFIDVRLPMKMEFKVIQAPPGERGNSTTSVTKTVVLETGLKINAPLFINEGDYVRVNTDTGEYVERVNK